MHYFDLFLEAYGWEGMALAAILVLLLAVQLHYYIFVYGAIPDYKNNKRRPLLESEPPVSIIVPLFSEDYTFIEERLPLILAQNYPSFEIIVVYVGQDNDFYEDVSTIKQSFPNIFVTKIHLNPRFPISRKMALNVGIKSAHYEHLLFTSTDAYPQSDSWLSLMAKGFMRGDIVIGYCGLEQAPGMGGYMMRAWRMMHSVDWLARAIRRRPYRGILHNFGFTKSLYFGVNGFGHLNMNIGEDDLFMQQIMTRDNVSVVLSPRASLCEKRWGGMKWWIDRLRYFGSSFRFFPTDVKNYIIWELSTRVLFFLSVLCALVVMPLEIKIFALVMAVVRLTLVLLKVKKIARRLGEEKMVGRYVFYDLLSPLWSLLVGVVLMRKDERVWR